MADTRKTKTASNKTDRSEEKPVDDSRVPEDVAAEETVEAAEAGVSEAAVETVDEVPAPEATPEEKAPDGDAIEDAEVIEEIAASEARVETVDEEDVTTSEPDEVARTAEEALDADEPSAEDVADLEALDGATPEQVTEASEERSRFTFEPEKVEHRQAVPSAGPETMVVERRGGVLSGFLGGVIATLGLAFAAPFVIPQNLMPDFGTKALKEELATLQGELGALQGNVESLQGSVAETAKAADIESLRTETGSVIGSLQEALSSVQSETAGLDETRSSVQSLLDATTTMTGRIDELEKRPIAEATDPASIAAVQAYGREVAQMREELAALMSRSEELVAQAAASAEEAVKVATSESQEAIAAAEAEAAAAAERAERAARAQAMVDIQAALESGAPFAEPLAQLSGIDIPEALSASAEEGVPTVAEVQKAFAPAARAALAASREVAEQESVQGRLTTFLKAQSGFRSLAPREGDDPDAVLSRAEAAALEARLEDAIAELSGLPEAGQQEMADWVALATGRAEAVAAADELAANLATN